MPDERRFDENFAVRVGLFYRDPGRALGIVGRRRASGGEVFVFHDPPSEWDAPRTSPSQRPLGRREGTL